MGCGCNMPTEQAYRDEGSILSGFTAWQRSQAGQGDGAMTFEGVVQAAEDLASAFGFDVDLDGSSSGTGGAASGSGGGSSAPMDWMGILLTGGAGAAAGAIVGDLAAREPWWGAGLGAATALGLRAWMAR